jgi:hypothetical protein
MEADLIVVRVGAAQQLAIFNRSSVIAAAPTRETIYNISEIEKTNRESRI